MNLIILLLLFVPLSIYIFRQKDWYACLLFTFYAILPDTFAIEISSHLPLITAGRILLLLNFAIYLAKNNGKLKVNVPNFFIVFFIGTTLIMILNVTKTISEFNDLFNLCLEQFLLLIIINSLIINRLYFFRYLKFLTVGFLLSSIIGILQTILNIDAAVPLHIVSGRAEFGLALRMGMTRAQGTTGSAILFASECTIMMLLMIYMYEQNNNLKYMILFCIFALTLICTMSRSSLIAVLFVLMIMFVFRFKKILLRYIKFVPAIFLVIILFNILFPSKMQSFLEPVKSVLNILGTKFEIANNFGDNANSATTSRTFQWSALQYMLTNGKILLGYGYNAYSRGLIHFYYSGYHAWDVAQALDVGFVALIAERGILGFGIYIYLLLSLLYTTVKKKSKYRISFYNIMFYILVLYILSNILTANIDDKLIWLVFGFFCSYINLQNKNNYPGEDKRSVT